MILSNEETLEKHNKHLRHMCENLHNSVHDYMNDGDHVKLEQDIQRHEPLLRELALNDEIIRSGLHLPNLIKLYDGFHL